MCHKDWVIPLTTTIIFRSFTSLAVMHLNGTRILVPVSSSNEYHFMTKLLRVSEFPFPNNFLSVLRGKEFIRSHGTFTVKPFPFFEGRNRSLKKHYG